MADDITPVDPSEPPKLTRAFFAALADHNIDHMHDNLTSRDFHIYLRGQRLVRQGVRQGRLVLLRAINGQQHEWRVDAHRLCRFRGRQLSASVIRRSRGFHEQAKTHHHWIETAYMVREDEALKVNFISSTSVNCLW